MVPRLPISTNITRQMSMQQPYDVRTLPRPPKKSLPPVLDFSEDFVDAADIENGGHHRKVASPTGRRKTADDIFSSANLEARGSVVEAPAAKPFTRGRERCSVRWSSDVSAKDESESVSESGGVHHGTSARLLSDNNSDKSLPLSSSPSSPKSSGVVVVVTNENRVVAEKRPPSNPAPLSGKTIEPGDGKLHQTVSSDAHRSSLHGGSRPQRVPSPEFPPPPPPEFLHAFQPSTSGWHQPPEVVTRDVFEMTFEDKLENELDFLEQQVSHLDRSPEVETPTVAGEDGFRNKAHQKIESVNGSGMIIDSTPTKSKQSTDRNDVDKNCNGAGYGISFTPHRNDLYLVNRTQPADWSEDTLVNKILSSNHSDSTLPNRPQPTNQGESTRANKILSSNHSDSTLTNRTQSTTHSDSTLKNKTLSSNHSDSTPQNCTPSTNDNRAHSALNRKLSNGNRSTTLPSPSIEQSTVLFNEYESPPPITTSHSELTFVGDASRFSRNGTLVRQKPPAPPRRMESTKLSVQADAGGANRPQTQYFIDDLDRVISQKQHHGAGGVSNLEVPLPPPPPLVLEDLTCVDFGDLPPPPTADLLAGLRTMRRIAPSRITPRRQ